MARIIDFKETPGMDIENTFDFIVDHGAVVQANRRYVAKDGTWLNVDHRAVLGHIVQLEANGLIKRTEDGWAAV